MEIAIDRRSDNAARVPFERPIELAHPEFHDAFEAEGVDLSPGGLAARASCLPQVGARLSCRLPGPSAEESLQAQAEVAWVQPDGPRRGQFGMRFVELDTHTRSKITRMVGEQPSQSTASSVHLMLEGMKRPVEARVVGHDEDAVVVEQDLPLLERGRRVSIGDGEAPGWQGCIRGVELKLDDGMPRLTVTVATQPARAPFEAEHAEQAPSDPRTVELDATADQLLTSPLPSEPCVLDEPEMSVREPASAAPVGEPFEPESRPATEARGGSGAAPVEAPAMRVPELDPFRATAASGSAGTDVARPRRPLLAAQAGARLAAFWQGLWLRVRRVLAPVQAKMKRSRARFRISSVPVAWGALRRMTGTRSRKSRKGQVGHANQRRKQSGASADWLRALALGVIAFVGMALAVYALLPGGGDAEPKVDVEASSAAPSSPARAKPREAEPTPTTDEDPGSGAAPNVDDGPAAAEETATSSDSPTFGAQRVPNGRTYTLRMTDPVEKLDGVADESGFTVQIPGSLSLDRAGPLAAAHPAVRRSMILNRGNRSELTVRFAEEVQPVYRVRGKGASLEIEIEVP